MRPRSEFRQRVVVLAATVLRSCDTDPARHRGNGSVYSRDNGFTLQNATFMTITMRTTAADAARISSRLWTIRRAAVSNRHQLGLAPAIPALAQQMFPKIPRSGENRDCNAVGRASAFACPWPHPAYVYYHGSDNRIPKSADSIGKPSRYGPSRYAGGKDRADLRRHRFEAARRHAPILGGRQTVRRRKAASHGTRYHGLNVIHPR